jgi:hypothetical protein
MDRRQRERHGPGPSPSFGLFACTQCRKDRALGRHTCKEHTGFQAFKWIQELESKNKTPTLYNQEGTP